MTRTRINFFRQEYSTVQKSSKHKVACCNSYINLVAKSEQKPEITKHPKYESEIVSTNTHPYPLSHGNLSSLNFTGTVLKPLVRCTIKIQRPTAVISRGKKRIIKDMGLIFFFKDSGAETK